MLLILNYADLVVKLCACAGSYHSKMASTRTLAVVIDINNPTKPCLRNTTHSKWKRFIILAKVSSNSCDNWYVCLLSMHLAIPTAVTLLTVTLANNKPKRIESVSSPCQQQSSQIFVRLIHSHELHQKQKNIVVTNK